MTLKRCSLKPPHEKDGHGDTLRQYSLGCHQMISECSQSGPQMAPCDDRVAKGKGIFFSKRLNQTIHSQFVNISPEMILILQDGFIDALLIDCRESYLHTFCCQNHQCFKVIKSILGMPGFRKRLVKPPFPKLGWDGFKRLTASDNGSYLQFLGRLKHAVAAYVFQLAVYN